MSNAAARCFTPCVSIASYKFHFTQVAFHIASLTLGRRIIRHSSLVVSRLIPCTDITPGHNPAGHNPPVVPRWDINTLGHNPPRSQPPLLRTARLYHTIHDVILQTYITLWSYRLVTFHGYIILQLPCQKNW